jgi:glycosyltransferase involved in cell wall biosynthesis
LLKSIVLIISDLNPRNLHLQPWRYLYQVAVQLHQLGHPVTLIGSEELTTTELVNLPVRYLKSTSNLKWKTNQALSKVVRQANPDVVVWHVGLNSFIHQNFDLGLAKPAIGVFTSPLYRLKDLKRLSMVKLLSGYRLSGMACLGSLLPMPFLRDRMRGANLEALVLQTETTRRNLEEHRLWIRPIFVIPPGVDEGWLADHSQSFEYFRQVCGYSKEDIVLVFFGSPDPLRGLPNLLDAFVLARSYNESLKLLVLSRGRCGTHETKRWSGSRRFVTKDIPGVRVVEGLLSQDILVSYVAAGDAVVLPFELVPSDAPLSLLEARALGKPIVTTRIACLPELAGESALLTRPGDIMELALALLQTAKECESPGTRLTSQSCKPSITRWDKVGEAWSQLIQKL